MTNSGAKNAIITGASGGIGGAIALRTWCPSPPALTAAGLIAKCYVPTAASREDCAAQTGNKLNSDFWTLTNSP